MFAFSEYKFILWIMASDRISHDSARMLFYLRDTGAIKSDSSNYFRPFKQKLFIDTFDHNNSHHLLQCPKR